MAPALLTAIDSTELVHLIVGGNALAASRCARSLEAGASVKLLAPHDTPLHDGVRRRVEEHSVEWLKRDFTDGDLTALGREEVGHVVDMVFVTLEAGNAMSAHISKLSRRLRIPVNVADAPNLCTFTLLSTYSDGPLQIGVTTSGRGCKLASRIRREVASSLPTGLGAAVDKFGTMRRRLRDEENAKELPLEPEVEDDSLGQGATFNRLVNPEDIETMKSRRMRWLAQICEYWPLSRLSSITDEDIETLLQSYSQSCADTNTNGNHTLRPRRGRIILAGSGPGHPDLLTRATHKAILSADLILADKLVPAPVMDLIPRRCEVHIARKFPGNADRAQEELLELGLSGVKSGKIVVRLKQGDPYIYGRGAEEFEFFRSHGFLPTVIPGITSALSAPLFAQIPSTHRAVSDEVLICTGTGRKGAAPDPPEYLSSRTVVFLMALHRLTALVESLTSEKKKWPSSTPCAIIERASCSDQRIIRTTLENVCAAIEEEGSRPPGLLVVGNSCNVLCKETNRWKVSDGFRGLDDLSLPEDPASLGIT